MDMTESLERRALLYGLLARLHTYPVDEQFLDAMAALRLEEPLPGLEEALGQMREAAAAFRTPTGIETLNVEATRLFEGPGGPAAPPYASFYLHGRLMGPAALSAHQFYLAHRALPDADVMVPPDQLALELGFMAHLAARSEQAAAAGSPGESWESLRASREFLEGHLLIWIPRFAEDVVRAADSAFFAGIARFTLAALEWDGLWLEALEAEQLEMEGVRR